MTPVPTGVHRTSAPGDLATNVRREHVEASVEIDSTRRIPMAWQPSEVLQEDEFKTLLDGIRVWV